MNESIWGAYITNREDKTLQTLRTGDRVKVIVFEHPAYGRVGSVLYTRGGLVAVKLDYDAVPVGVAPDGLRRVKRSGV